MRIVYLGNARLGVADVHALVTGCPHLVQLGGGFVQLINEGGKHGSLLFDLRSAGVYPAMRSLGLPVVSSAGGGVAARVAPARAAFPSLREIDAEAYGNDANEVTKGARTAHQLGVRRFVCQAFFDGRYDSDGGFGSDGGSCGEYCGDGDVIKFMFGTDA
jgi:hypothetical protein